MTRIRVPKAALPFLVYCKTNPARRDDACFGSYAELVVFLASYGFRETKGRINQVLHDVLETGPDPIELNVFKNQGFFSQILLLGLAVTNGHSIAKNEESLANLVETLACAGAVSLMKEWDRTTPEGFVFHLVELISKTESPTAIPHTK